MTFNEYRSAPGLNFSRLKRMAKSALDFHVQPPKYTTALGLGRAIHTAVLEPDEFSDYVVFDGDKRTKAWKEFKVANEGKEMLGRKDMDVCESIASAVQRHPVASSYFAHGRAEVSIQWQHPIGMACKSRLDWVSDNVVLDLKSAIDITQDGFARACAKYAYHAQLAFYEMAARSVDGRERKAVILAVEKESPFDVAPYVLPEEAMQAGRRLVNDWMLKVRACELANHWPGVAEDETELHLPPWAFDEMDDATLIIDGVEVAI